MQHSVKPLPSIKNRSDFLAQRQSPRFSCDAFILQGNLSYCARNTARVGYTVTKKIGNSVVRSRIKRRLRSAVSVAVQNAIAAKDQQSKPASDLPHRAICGDMVIVARRSVLSDDYQNLVAKLTKGIDRLVTKGNKAA